MHWTSTNQITNKNTIAVHCMVLLVSIDQLYLSCQQGSIRFKLGVQEMRIPIIHIFFRDWENGNSRYFF